MALFNMSIQCVLLVIFLIAKYTFKLRFLAAFVSKMAGEVSLMLVIFVAIDAIISSL